MVCLVELYSGAARNSQTLGPYRANAPGVLVPGEEDHRSANVVLDERADLGSFGAGPVPRHRHWDEHELHPGSRGGERLEQPVPLRRSQHAHVPAVRERAEVRIFPAPVVGEEEVRVSNRPRAVVRRREGAARHDVREGLAGEGLDRGPIAVVPAVVMVVEHRKEGHRSQDRRHPLMAQHVGEGAGVAAVVLRHRRDPRGPVGVAVIAEHREELRLRVPHDDEGPSEVPRRAAAERERERRRHRGGRPGRDRPHDVGDRRRVRNEGVADQTLPRPFRARGSRGGERDLDDLRRVRRVPRRLLDRRAVRGRPCPEHGLGGPGGPDRGQQPAGVDRDCRVVGRGRRRPGRGPAGQRGRDAHGGGRARQEAPPREGPGRTSIRRPTAGTLRSPWLPTMTTLPDRAHRPSGHAGGAMVLPGGLGGWWVPLGLLRPPYVEWSRANHPTPLSRTTPHHPIPGGR